MSKIGEYMSPNIDMALKEIDLGIIRLIRK